MERSGAPLAAIIHDAALAGERSLLETAGAAARLALENERLDAELRARVEELERPRERIIEAGLAERRKLERNLHDGVQQRLVALALNIRLARDRMGRDPEDARELLEEAMSELQSATSELRELARGIHPNVLSEQGLSAALKALGGRVSVPVEIVVTPTERMPPLIEIASYYVIAEALTKITKYAQANAAEVRVHQLNGSVSVAVTDGTAAPTQPTDQGSVASPTASRRSTDGLKSTGRWARHDDHGANAIRIVLGEDSVLLREGIARLLGDAGFEVVAQAGDATDLLRKVRAHRPDVAIVDIRMPPTHTDEGLRAARVIRAELPKTAVLVLSGYVEEDYAVELLAESAEGVGYLLKDRVADVERFIDSIRRVADGGSALDPEVVSQMLGRRRSAGPLDELTSRRPQASDPPARGLLRCEVGLGVAVARSQTLEVDRPAQAHKMRPHGSVLSRSSITIATRRSGRRRGTSSTAPARSLRRRSCRAPR